MLTVGGVGGCFSFMWLSNEDCHLYLFPQMEHSYHILKHLSGGSCAPSSSCSPQNIYHKFGPVFTGI